MIILWHGLGWLGLVLLVLASAVVSGLEQVTRNGAPLNEDVRFGITLLLAAPFLWYLGRVLRHYKISAKTESGETVAIRQPYHSIFLIPVHWWGPICVALGMWLLVAKGARTIWVEPRKDFTPLPARRETGGALSYSVEVPPGWTLTRNQEQFDIVLTKTGSSYIAFYALPGAHGDTDRWAEILQRKYPSFLGGEVARNQSVMIDDRSWVLLQGNTEELGVPFICRVYAHAEEGSAYAIMAFVQQTEWQTSANDFDTVARSFRFPLPNP